jgi:hypothetical protein
MTRVIALCSLFAVVLGACGHYGAARRPEPTTEAGRESERRPADPAADLEDPEQDPL